MALIVQKFGGSSVADAERIFRVAGRITKTYAAGNDVVVVLSAQGDTTDDLISKAEEINPNASRREMDMLLACGEQQSIALMAPSAQRPAIRWCRCADGRSGSRRTRTTRTRASGAWTATACGRSWIGSGSCWWRASRALTGAAT